ncbi:MAG TPA: MBL fold metallo-hydrolase, partial [Candidatus Limnocylindrales bacterium]|nr:MBL fold metallo-hydrolase [Candidatus Limnocylindrales bacterium]
REVGAGVFVRRYQFFDQDIVAVVGDGELLVVDTRTTYRQADELQADLRALTPVPWRVVVSTHEHYDHTFGNGRFRGCAIWGHERCATRMLERGEAARRKLAAEIPELADELTEVEIVPPDHTFAEAAQIHVGGRRVELSYHGRGHTDNDIAVRIPDASVVLLGDLIEQGAPPSFGDSYPVEWPETLGRILPSIAAGVAVVPGHGDVVDRAFVEAQAAELAALADLARAIHAGELGHDDAAARAPFGGQAAQTALRRGVAQLAGTLD